MTEETTNESTTEKKPKKVKEQKKQPNPISRYLRETRGELRKVTWPTWDETWRLTLIVLGVSAVTAIYLGLLLDTLFSRAVLGILRLTLGI